jgi:hypothetical protein
LRQRLTERYRERLAGVLSCYDRIVITGTLPGACYAGGRTGGPFVIDAFFVRTADNSVCHHDGPSSCRVDQREHFFCYAGITADIGPFGEPASKIGSFGILCRHDADGELGGSGIVWAVEGDRRNRVAAKSSLGSLAQPLTCMLNHLFVVAR